MTSRPTSGKTTSSSGSGSTPPLPSSQRKRASAATGTHQETASSAKRDSSSNTPAVKSSRGKKKKSVAKPIGPAVYASDVVAGTSKLGADTKGSSVLPDSMNTAAQDTLELSPIEADLPMEERPAQVLKLAEEAFGMTGSWVVFYRTMIAPGGVVDELYSTANARRYFETTREFAELLEMVTALRSQDDCSSGVYEPTRMITIRVPRSLHAATIRESDELELSINAYCVTKLLQPANPRFTPLELGNRRGRRPGPQMFLTKVKVKSKKKSRASKG